MLVHITILYLSTLLYTMRHTPLIVQNPQVHKIAIPNFQGCAWHGWLSPTELLFLKKQKLYLYNRKTRYLQLYYDIYKFTSPRRAFSLLLSPNKESLYFLYSVPNTLPPSEGVLNLKTKQVTQLRSWDITGAMWRWTPNSKHLFRLVFPQSEEAIQDRSYYLQFYTPLTKHSQQQITAKDWVWQRPKYIIPSSFCFEKQGKLCFEYETETGGHYIASLEVTKDTLKPYTNDAVSFINKEDHGLAVFSPKSDRVAWLVSLEYRKRGKKKQEIWVSDLRGKNATLLKVLSNTRVGEYGAQLSWLPDESALSYTDGTSLCIFPLSEVDIYPLLPSETKQ